MHQFDFGKNKEQMLMEQSLEGSMSVLSTKKDTSVKLELPKASWTLKMDGSTTGQVIGEKSVDTLSMVKLPSFWKENPALWFAQVEAAFYLNRITSDESRFRYVIFHLDQTALSLVADIVTSPPDKDKYDRLKGRLIASLGETNATKIRRLLGSYKIGKEKPSVFLQRLRSLAAGQVNDEVLRAIFMEQLPDKVRRMLAIIKVADLNKLAAQADKIMEMTKPMVVVQMPKAGASDGIQKTKILKRVKMEPPHIIIPEERFKHIHVDIVGPLPESQGYKYCVTIIDRYTRWPEAIPVRERSAQTIAEAIYATWISRYGTPEKIITDRGMPFESEIFRSLAKMLGTQRIRIIASHPSSHRLLERWHRSLNTAIVCHQNKDWVDILPTVLLGLRTSYKEDLKTSAAEMLYGTTLRIPGEFLEDDISTQPRQYVEKLRKQIRLIRPTPLGCWPSSYHRKNSLFFCRSLRNSTHVFLKVDAIKQPLESPYEGPFEVVDRPSDKIFTIKRNGRIESISIESLRPAFIEKDGLQTEEVPQELRTYQGKQKK